jgi:hypothetical protein
MRAAKQLGMWVEGTIALPEGGQAADMLSDIALFEPNQRGRRAFDVFLASKARQLDAADFELAQRMGKALFSLFRCTGRHGIAGVWLEDQLDRNRTLWLIDEGMQASALTKGASLLRQRHLIAAFEPTRKSKSSPCSSATSTNGYSSK